jgi:preprotein translocase subunit SecD
VSFLAAAILYLLAIGDVKGFAFTLGMSTVLDLVVVFLFTHPLMAVLSRFKRFGSSRFSGLGNVDRLPTAGTRQAGRELVSAGAQDRSTS